MTRTPIRSASVAATNLAVAHEPPAQPSRADQIAELRARMAAIGGEVPERVVEDTETLAVGGALSLVLPNGGVPRRAVTHVSDTPALVVELIGQVVGSGGYAGVVGWPELSYAGIDRKHLGRVIAVPDPGVDPLGIAGVLAEGLDLVVYRSLAQLALSPVRCRPLLGKLRTGRAALMLVGATVPSPALTVTGEIQSFRGIGRGTGRITGVDIRVRAQSKSTHPASATVTVGQAEESSISSGATAGHPALKVVR
ncbi:MULTISPECIES: hypothetical protein [unclassified Corynebacterium]|uniref:hypothetical protein n=1 Tax=unclassified Corynebacterium TaxID=2624378 RepID=UPI00264D2FC5|nr:MULTISPECIES: hypothetical protein [unclassified Corynebacterium]MDN8595323.1 hypothetical protein [Corynebacterium sp. P4_F2]WKK54809.1 hypothetical protein QYR03_06080 [Corynebacterium sp. P4-C1]WKK64186.1 hypothetical protein QYR04_04700 [Corynebacterium sp. P8-C1]